MSGRRRGSWRPLRKFGIEGRFAALHRLVGVSSIHQTDGGHMTDEQKDQEEGRWSSPEEAEVEAHRQANPRQSHPMSDEGEGRMMTHTDDDDDEVEAHRWGTHSPEDPNRLIS